MATIDKDNVFNLLDDLRKTHSMNDMQAVVRYMEQIYGISKDAARQYLEDWMRSRKENNENYIRGLG
jgi:hypothetical protein